MRQRPTLRPRIETLESFTLLSTLPLPTQVAAAVHTEAASNTVHELEQFALAGTTLAGSLKGEYTDAKDTRFMISVSFGHYDDKGPGQQRDKPVSMILDYTVKNGTFTFKSGELTLPNLSSRDSEVVLKLSLSSANRKLNANTVTQFEYTVKHATGKFKGTKAQGNATVAFTGLWAPINGKGYTSAFTGSIS